MKNFKISAILVGILIFGFLPTLYGQGTIGGGGLPEPPDEPLLTQERGTNLISCSDYHAIKYNGYTIDQINATEGDSTQIKQMWGNYSSLDVVDIVEIYKYKYGTNRFSFRASNFTGMTIKESSWPIQVLGKNINVGDPFSELQQKFGQDLKILHSPELSAYYSVSFGCSKIDSDGLLIRFDPETNKVVKIKYFQNP